MTYKVITIPDKFLQADERPFRQAKRDRDGDLVLRHDDKGEVMHDAQGNALVETENATFLDTLKGFLNLAFVVAKNKKAEMTIEDSSLAYDIFRAVRVVADGRLELEKVPYERLLEWVNKYAVDIFPGANAAVFKEVLTNATDGETIRAERRRQEKQEK